MNKRSLTSFIGPRYWFSWIGLLILRIVALLPLPLVAFLGAVVGFLFYCLVPSRRRIAFKNINSCFPEKSQRELKMINRKHFLYAGQLVFTSSMNWWVSKERFNRWVAIDGKEHYTSALAEGKNIIMLAPHFISLEVAGLALSQERPMISMYQYSKNTLMDEVMLRGRARFGGLLVERKAPLRTLIKLIRQGAPFYYLPDQDAGRKGVFVPFFNELASTTPMLGKFADMTDAVVIPCLNIVKPWGRGYQIKIGAPLLDFPLGDELIDTARMNQVIADMVNECPEQYFWAHKRYKTRPEGAPKFYK